MPGTLWDYEGVTINGESSLGLNSSFRSFEVKKLADLDIYPADTDTVEKVWKKSIDMQYCMCGRRRFSASDRIVEPVRRMVASRILLGNMRKDTGLIGDSIVLKTVIILKIIITWRIDCNYHQLFPRALCCPVGFRNKVTTRKIYNYSATVDFQAVSWYAAS